MAQKTKPAPGTFEEVMERITSGEKNSAPARIVESAERLKNLVKSREPKPIVTPPPPQAPKAPQPLGPTKEQAKADAEQMAIRHEAEETDEGQVRLSQRKPTKPSKVVLK